MPCLKLRKADNLPWSCVPARGWFSYQTGEEMLLLQLTWKIVKLKADNLATFSKFETGKCGQAISFTVAK